MSRLLDKLNSTEMCLIVSIPCNNYELAKLAWEAGADAVKVHMNVWHRASGNTFGTLEDNRETFEKILRDCPVPVGIVPGENAFTCEENMDEVVKMGFDFISLYGHHTPASAAVRTDIGKFYGINCEYSYDEIDSILNSPFVDILELAVCDPKSYGERLNARDLVKYHRIATSTKVPTVVPTQHVVYPSDVPALHKCGVKAVMVGAVVFGKEDPQHISEVIKAFRAEVDKVCAK